MIYIAIVNLTNYDYWGIEILEKQTITISSTVNDFGTMYYDDNNNLMSGNTVGIGRQDLVQMLSNTNGNLIIYTPEADYYQFIDSTYTESERDKYFILNTKYNNKYYTNADRHESTSISSNKITVDLTGKSVFKVIVNGYECTSYSYDTTGVTITGEDVYNVNEYDNNSLVYYYDTNQAVTGETIFEYYAPEVYYLRRSDGYEDETFFDKENIHQICLFDDLTISDSRVLWNKDVAYKYNQRQRKVDQKITIGLNNKEDIRGYVKNKYFRLFGWSGDDGKFVSFNNCLIQEGVDISFTKNGANSYDYNITVEDYFVVDYKDGSPYGTSDYGTSPYGGVFTLIDYFGEVE